MLISLNVVIISLWICTISNHYIVNLKYTLHICVLVAHSCLTLCDPMACPWNSLGKNTGVDCHSLLQGIFLIQRSNPGLLHYRQTLCVWAQREANIIYFKRKQTKLLKNGSKTVAEQITSPKKIYRWQICTRKGAVYHVIQVMQTETIIWYQYTPIKNGQNLEHWQH